MCSFFPLVFLDVDDEEDDGLLLFGIDIFDELLLIIAPVLEILALL